MDNSILNDNIAEYKIFNNGTFFIGFIEGKKYYDGIITFDNGDFFIGKCVDKEEYVHFVTGKLYDADRSLLRHYDDNVELDVTDYSENIVPESPGVIIRSESDKPSMIIYNDGTVFFGDIIDDDPVNGILTLADGKYFIGELVKGKIKFLTGSVYYNNGDKYCIIHNTRPVTSLTEDGPEKKDRIH
jgi:hypothetical protein